LIIKVLAFFLYSRNFYAPFVHQSVSSFVFTGFRAFVSVPTRACIARAS
jgi:hypothetical protein